MQINFFSFFLQIISHGEHREIKGSLYYSIVSRWLFCTVFFTSFYTNLFLTFEPKMQILLASASFIISSRLKMSVFPAVTERQVAPARIMAAIVGTPTTG